MTAYQSHGTLIPPRFSRSRPHCLIPRPRGAVLSYTSLQKHDWTEVSLSSCVSLPHGKLSRFPSFIFLARSFEVVAYGLRGCRDFIPAAGLTYSECCIFNFQVSLKNVLFTPFYSIGTGRDVLRPLFSKKLFIFFFDCSMDFRTCLYETPSIVPISRSVNPS